MGMAEKDFDYDLATWMGLTTTQFPDGIRPMYMTLPDLTHMPSRTLALLHGLHIHLCQKAQ